MTTLREISAKVGVAPSTVSLVLNGRPVPCRPHIRRQILALAKEVNYSPNQLARSLRNRKTHTIGLVTPGLAMSLDELDAECRASGYALQVTSTNYDPAIQSDVIRQMRDRRVDGILLVNPIPYSDAVVELQQSTCPSVIVDMVHSYPRMDSFLIDVRGGSELVVDYLISLGHRRIAAAFADSAYPFSTQRREGSESSFRKAGMEMHPDWYIPLSSDRRHADAYREGYKAAEQFIARFPRTDLSRPTALYTSVDEVAIGAIAGFKDAGWRVPVDVSVVGMQALEVGRYCQVPVTTVDIDHLACRLQALQHLLSVVRDEYKGPRPRLKQYSAKLVVRASTTPPSS